MWSRQATLATRVRHRFDGEGLGLRSKRVAVASEVFPEGGDDNFEVGLGFGSRLGPSPGGWVPGLVVERAFLHVMQLVEDRALVLDLRPAHLSMVVQSATGGAGGAVGRAMESPVGGLLLFAVAWESAIVADASSGLALG